MKQLRTCETFLASVVLLVILHLLFFPMYSDILKAQNLDGKPIVVSHYPVTKAYQGKALNIIAFVAADAAVAKVTLNLTSNGKTIKGAVPHQSKMGVVPVIVQADQDLIVYSGPGIKYRVRGAVKKGEQVYVNRIRDGYYRIQSAIGVVGYVDAALTKVVKTGKAYGVSVPASMTSADYLTYQITAVDALGNTVSTDLIQTRLLTNEEVLALQGGKQKQVKKQPKSGQELSSQKSIFAKPLFWLGLAAVGGGTYYLVSQQDSKDKEAEFNIILDTE